MDSPLKKPQHVTSTARTKSPPLRLQLRVLKKGEDSRSGSRKAKSFVNKGGDYWD